MLFEVDAATGSALLTGTFQTGVNGKRVEIGPGIFDALNVNFRGLDGSVSSYIQFTEAPNGYQSMTFFGPLLNGTGPDDGHFSMDSNGSTYMKAATSAAVYVGPSFVPKIYATPTGLGFNGFTAIAKPTLNAAATTAAETTALVNQIRQGLINYGLFQ